MPATRQGQPTSAADRALIVAQVDALMTGPDALPLRRACAELQLNHNNYYRWKADADTTPRAPKDKMKRGRKALVELSEPEVCRLRFWRLVRGSIPLAVEAFIAESRGQDLRDSTYFNAVARLAGKIPEGHAASEETGRILWEHWQRQAKARKVVVWPMSVQRACRVTEAEEAMFRGAKAYEYVEGSERRSGLIITPEGEQVPWYAGAIYESDDESENDPHRYFDQDAGGERLARQSLKTLDAYSLSWLGFTHLGRYGDSYRAEDIADHFSDIVAHYGLPYIWRVERGRWENHFIWGCPIGHDENGDEKCWGGLTDIIHIRKKFKSKGKANVEGGFNIGQNMRAHGGDGRTVSIGRIRGEFEAGSRSYLRAQDGDVRELAKFQNIGDSADRVAAALQALNLRPKKRYNFNNETRIPAELFAELIKRPCPSDHQWRFLPIKQKATVKNGIITVKVRHYAQSFRFRLHGSAKCPNFIAANGHEVLVAFHPARAWEGLHVFNADTSARNRDNLSFGQRIGIAMHMEDAPQEDLHSRTGYSPGQKAGRNAVRREFRPLIAGTAFTQRRSHAQDSFGNQLARQTGQVEDTPAVREATAIIPAPSRRNRPADLEISTPRRGGEVAATPGAEDFDEALEAAALSLR